MEQEMTQKELIALINDMGEDFLIQIELKEGDICEERCSNTDG